MSERMRIKVTIAIILVTGAILTANLLMGARTLSPADFEEVTTACSGCHGLVPDYDSALQVHDKHAAFECSSCHGNVGGLKTADNFHAGLEWLGIGMACLALLGIITSVLVSRKAGAS